MIPLNIKIIPVLIAFITAPVIESYSMTDDHQLSTDYATLKIEDGSTLVISRNEDQKVIAQTSLADLWEITLENNATGRGTTLSPPEDVNIRDTQGKIELRYEDVGVDRLNIVFSISKVENSFSFGGRIQSEAKEWTIKELRYPRIHGIQIPDGETTVYWPAGLGKKITSPEEFGSRTLRYSSAMEAAMPWFSLNTSQSGLYMGVHDSTGQEPWDLKVAYAEDQHAFAASIHIPINKPEFDIPRLAIMPYEGEWYQAAEFYRAWYDKHFDIVSPPEWVRQDAGWVLAILKQQNGNVMWDYSEIDKLVDIALRNNLTTLGLFGWAQGGHDHLYPNYVPDPLMGGRQEIIKAIEHAHQKGVEVILYANGKLIDTRTDFYLDKGVETIVALNEEGKPHIDFYLKHSNNTPVVFARACPGSPIWRERMKELAIQAANLGADGILYDQLAVLPPEICYSKHHDHAPGESDGKYRTQMVREIREAARKINPEFIVMTEGTDDAILSGIDYFHGWGNGFQPSENTFPTLFRYTFPEIVMTQRNPNPMVTRKEANFAAVRGLRHEIESRYTGDVEYLENRIMPDRSTYSDEYVNYPPNVEEVNQVSPREAEKYLHGLIEFEKEHSNLLWNGKFIAQKGLTVEGEDIVARGYAGNDKLGVMVWNRHLSEERDFSVSASGYRLAEADEPLSETEVQPLSPLKANSIRLLVFERQ